jgi:hypothetical protein
MLGVVTGGTIGGRLCAVWPRRWALLLGVLAALLAARGPVCTDAMMTAMPVLEPTSMSQMVLAPAPVGPAQAAAAATPARVCQAVAPTTTGSPTGLGPCVTLPPTAITVTSALLVPAAAPSGVLVTPPPPATAVVVAVLRHAATLYQLGLLRT